MIYPENTFGCIVNYFDIIDDDAEILQFDVDIMNKKSLSNKSIYIDKVPRPVEECLLYFDDMDSSVEGILYKRIGLITIL